MLMQCNAKGDDDDDGDVIIIIIKEGNEMKGA